jgi:hypothetical protein
MWTLFIIADVPGLRVSATDVAAMKTAVQRIPGLAHARVMTPDTSAADQPFAADGPGPELALQLYFTDEAAAHAALAPGSHLPTLPVLSHLPATSITHQLMRARVFATGAASPTDTCLTFLVTYPCSTPDPQHWLDHYDTFHPPIMVTFPKIQEVETYRPVPWSSTLPFRRGDVLQRNKVVFNSMADLLAALASPVMLAMRADSKGFPPFTGKATHFPMITWRVDA